MTGLDKIIAEIRDEAAVEADRAIASAKAQADEYLAAAKKESDAVVARIEAGAAQDVADIERSRESSLVLQRRQRTLAQKQTLLSQTLEIALDSLYRLPDAEYFSLLAKLAAAHAQKGDGVMLLNTKDKARVPADFAQKVAASLPAGSTLSVSDQTRPIDGGFVLKYGDIEENCSFRDIFNARVDEFSDLVRETLFA